MLYSGHGLAFVYQVSGQLSKGFGCTYSLRKMSSNGCQLCSAPLSLRAVSRASYPLLPLKKWKFALQKFRVLITARLLSAPASKSQYVDKCLQKPVWMSAGKKKKKKSSSHAKDQSPTLRIHSWHSLTGAAAMLSPKAQDTAAAIAPLALPWTGRCWQTAAGLPYTRISAQTSLVLHSQLQAAHLVPSGDGSLLHCISSSGNDFIPDNSTCYNSQEEEGNCSRNEVLFLIISQKFRGALNTPFNTCFVSAAVKWNCFLKSLTRIL